MKDYWDSRAVLSYNTDIAIVEGDRNIGKSYGQLIRAIMNTKRHRASMCWLRRTEAEADELARSVGSGKWRTILARCGFTSEDVKRSGRRVSLRVRGEWRPCIRYAALVEWNDLRDSDEPNERYIFLDEAFTTLEKRRRYAGDEVRDFLDIYVSLRREKERFPALICGNADQADNPYLNYFGLEPNKRGGVELLSTGNGKFNRIAYERVRREAVGSFANTVKGTRYGAFLDGVPHGVNPALFGTRDVRCENNCYAAFDLCGYISIWYAKKGGLIVDITDAKTDYFVAFPNGDPRAYVFTNEIRKRLVVLRDAWRAGRVRFTNATAFERGAATIARIL